MGKKDLELGPPMTDTDINEICKGCLMHENGVCSGYKKNTIACPCITCLVKVMCTNSCIEYIEYLKWC